jgi:hypothetical protein
VCARIGVCAPGAAPADPAPRRPLVLRNLVRRSRLSALPAAFFCDVCQDIVHAIEDLVLEGVAEDVIEAAADAICDLLPMPARSFCISVVDREIEDIINWIVQGIDALDICGNLGFCGADPVRR